MHAQLKKHYYTTSTNGDKYMNNKTNTSLTLPLRNNYEKITNRNGKGLLQLCWSHCLYIVNSWLRGGSLGRYTYSSSRGSSTADYALTYLDPFSLRAVTVRQQPPFSDHNQLRIYLKRLHSNQPCSNSSNLYNITTQ